MSCTTAEDPHLETSFTFLGNHLDRKDGRPVSVLTRTEHSSSINCEIDVFLDTRVFKVSNRKEEKNCELYIDDEFPEVKYIIEELRKKCSQQTIRGIPLLQLLQHLTFVKDVTVTIVGGAVRNTLRRFPSESIHDIDLCIGGIDYLSLKQVLLEYFASRGRPLSKNITRSSEVSMKFGWLTILKGPNDLDDLDFSMMSSRGAKHVSPRQQCQCHESDLLTSTSLFGNSFYCDAALRDIGLNAIYVDVKRPIFSSNWTVLRMF